MFALMAQAIAEGVVAALTELQAQVAAGVLVTQGVQRHPALNFAKENTEDTLRLKAGLQLQAKLLTQVRKADWPFQKGRLLTKAQALQFGAIKVNCVGLGRWFHKACAPRQ
ncbi:hypothetical protein D3C81_1726540 [compost metagenome]